MLDDVTNFSIETFTHRQMKKILDDNYSEKHLANLKYKYKQARD